MTPPSNTSKDLSSAPDDSNSLPILTVSKTVVEGGFCIGCGACAASKDPSFSIQMNELGMYQASLNSDTGCDTQNPSHVSAEQVCPFSQTAPNEDEIAKYLYEESGTYTNKIGYHTACYAGAVVDESIRSRGSSGGMGTWILLELLQQGKIDGVIHVGGSDDNDGVPFAYKISTTEKQILERSKSRYYPVEMSSVIQQVREMKGRFAIVGLPCFIKAVRLLAKHDQEIDQRIAFTVALFCGHLKSKHFADFFAWQAGIKPGELSSVNFRTKLPNLPASNYGITVGSKGVDHCRQNSEYAGSSWGYGFFKYKACDYCDDVVGETADISVGDAWLSEYVNDSGGTNVVIVRHPVIAKLVDAAIDSNRLDMTRISPEKVIESQDAGLRHRREGLAYRLSLRDAEDSWRPTKRVDADGTSLNKRQKQIFTLREQIAAKSHKAFQVAIKNGKFESFSDQMRPVLDQYDALYRPTKIAMAKTKIKRVLSKIKRVGIALTRSRGDQQ